MFYKKLNEIKMNSISLMELLTNSKDIERSKIIAYYIIEMILNTKADDNLKEKNW